MCGLTLFAPFAANFCFYRTGFERFSSRPGADRAPFGAMRSFAALFCLLAALLTGPRDAFATDPAVDSAVTALARLTDPLRLEALPEDQFRAQLGPALGWLHLARRRDVAPESVIARAFAFNGLEGERARLTRSALLSNLARADAWELFQHPVSARALSNGWPAPIPAGVHRGHLAQAAVIQPEGLDPQDHREFACLVLRADDENPPRPAPGSHRRQPGDMLARRAGLPSAASGRLAARGFSPPPAGVSVVRPGSALVAVANDNANASDDPLPVSYVTRGSNEGGTVVVREEVTFGEEVSLAALGGPAARFVLRGADGAKAHFDLIDDGPDVPAAAPAQLFAVPLAQGGPAAGRVRVWRIYERPGALRISLYDAAPGASSETRTVLFEFPPARR